MSASRKARCYSDGGEVSPRDQKTVDEFFEYLKRADHRTRRDRLFDADLAVVCPNMLNRAGYAVSDLS